MAKDDYFVIVYYILSYLYSCLKRGKQVDEDILMLKNYKAEINEEYITYIYDNLYKDKYIEGIVIKRRSELGSYKVQVFIADLYNTRITPKGIEYLEENSMFKKIKENVKDIKELIQFI
ncbi:MAG: hypothetical protein HXL16_05970 [Peptostreptococcaceae bacterium]|nr:hypothetical protein [Peptostreptococcaceae bacterium]